MKRRRLLILIGLLAAVTTLLTASESILAWYGSFQVDKLQVLISGYGIRGKLLFFGLASIRPLTLLPVTVFFVTGGLVFGTLEGSFWAIAGLVISSSLCYWLAFRFRLLFHRIVHRKYIRKVQEAAATNLVSKLFSLRTTPGMPFDLISYAAGLTGISYRRFLLGTLLGVIPRGVLYTYLGDNLDNYLSLQTLTIYGVLLATALAPHLYHQIQKCRHPAAYAVRQSAALSPWKPPER